MYANTINEAEIRMSELLNEQKVKNNMKLEKDLTNNTRGNNTNNFSESSIRIFKDVVLQRCCKVFNMCALVEFIANTFESYHKVNSVCQWESEKSNTSI